MDVSGSGERGLARVCMGWDGCTGVAGADARVGVDADGEWGIDVIMIGCVYVNAGEAARCGWDVVIDTA